jgi:hypothetical protein
MKTAIAAVLLALVAGSAPAFADKTITDNNKTATIDCATDATVSIEGNGNTVTLMGACTHVTVAGNHNKVAAVSSASVDVTGNENAVTVDAVDTLAVPGNKNVVDYKAAVAKGGKTKVSNPGTGNKVTRSK